MSDPHLEETRFNKAEKKLFGYLLQSLVSTTTNGGPMNKCACQDDTVLNLVVRFTVSSQPAG